MSTGAAAAVASAMAGLALLGCGRPVGLWRDQHVFVGDDGTVVPVAVLRWSDGRAEMKGWLGRNERWEGSFHEGFSISSSAAPSVRRTLEAFSALPASPARVSIDGEGAALRLRLRTRSEDLRFSSDAMRTLGRTDDPEGPSIYRAGRGSLQRGAERRPGWIVIESTPATEPRRAFVDYGDFALVFAASRAGGATVVKRSLDRDGFDHAFAYDGIRVRHTTRVVAEVGDGGAARVALPELSLAAELRAADHTASRGTAPGGAPVRYQTWLLAGDAGGVAFLIRPDRRGST